MKIIFLFIHLLPLSLFAQNDRVYTLFGAPEHMQDPAGYQTIESNGKKYQKSIVFVDVNFSIEEIQKANQAAKELGKNLIVLPKMDWSKRRKMSEMMREVESIRKNKIPALEKKLSQETDEAKKIEIKEQITQLEKKKEDNNKKINEVFDDPNYTLRKKNLPILLKQMEEDGLTLDSLVVSGHSSGTDGEGGIKYWGDYEGSELDIDRDDIIDVIQENEGKPSVAALNHVYISACNAMTPYEAKVWMKGLPSINHCTGYQGRAGRGYYPSMNNAIKEDLTSSEIFYQNLIAMDEKDREKALEEQLLVVQKNYPNDFLNLSMATRNPDGTFDYSGMNNGKKKTGDLEKLAFEESAEICKTQANEIISDYTPEFLKIKSQITLYKMAWSTLILSGVHKNEETKSIETVLNKNIKDFFEKVETDPSYKQQYEQLLAYESPYKTKWMTKGQNYMPLAIEFMSTQMNSPQFLEKVMKETYKGSVGEAVLPRVQEDMRKYGVDMSDAKTMELLHDLHKNDKYSNNFLSNINTQINASFRGRGGLKGVDELYFKKEIDKLNGDFEDLNKKIMAQLKDKCESEEKFIEYYSNGRCKVTDPTEFRGILTFTPLLEKLTLKDYDIGTDSSGYNINRKGSTVKTKIDKKYLKVSPKKGECNFTFQDNHLPVISFKDIPQNGEYYIAYVGESGKSKEQLLSELNGQIKSGQSYKKNNDNFQNFLKSNNIFTKKIMSEEIKFTGNSTGTFFKHDFDQSEIDPKRAHFDGIDGGYNIKIDKSNIDKFLILSSWGNNKKQINCKEGKILKPESNPVRIAKIKEEEERKKKEELEERQRLLTANPNINKLNDPNAMIPIDNRLANQTYTNAMDQNSRIRLFHQDNQNLGDYMVLDKKASRMYLYNKDGFLERIIDVDLKAESGDQLPGKPKANGETYNTIGAGIFTTDRKGRSDINVSNDVIFLEDQRSSGVKTSIRSSESNPNCTNCIKVPQEYMKLVLSHMNNGERFYVLPEDDKNYFKVKNNDIQYTTSHQSATDSGFVATDYNYSPKDMSYYENQSILKGTFTYTDNITPVVSPRLTDLTLINPILMPIGIVDRGIAANNGIERTVDLSKHPTAIEYVQTLDQEKKKIMEMYKIDNDEYNQLQKYAFGILGNESEFGLGNKYLIKEGNQGLVDAVKYVKGNDSPNSRGLTQIKEVPKAIVDEYGVNLNDLNDPSKAAVATMGVLAEKLSMLKRIEHKHPDITPENRMDYLLYLYYGNSRQITEGKATPDANNYIQNVKKYSENYLEIYQTKEEVK